MKPIFLIIFLQVTFFYSYSQTLDKKAIDGKVELNGTGTDKLRTRFYIINGVAFDEQETNKIDSVLKSYNPKYLANVNVITCQQANLPHCDDDIIIVFFAYKQKNEIKRRLLKKVRKRFTDHYGSFSQHMSIDAKDPVLYIDNELIHYTQAKEKIKTLKPSSVYYIDFSDKPVSKSRYGQNGKNGLVRIWTSSE